LNGCWIWKIWTMRQCSYDLRHLPLGAAKLTVYFLAEIS
jgi:hypothetical protein